MSAPSRRCLNCLNHSPILKNYNKMKNLRTISLTFFALVLTILITGCKEKEPVLPMTVTTLSSTNLGPGVTKVFATVNNYDGSTLQGGVNFSALHSPTEADSGLYTGYPNPNFEVTLTLEAGKTYYAKARVEGNDGVVIMGNEITFTTLP
jgi:hypothetical protein